MHHVHEQSRADLEFTFLQSELLFSDFPNNLPPAEFSFAVTVPDLPLVIGI